MPVWLRDFLGDRIQINSMLIVLCFVSVLTLGSQSAASYPSYLLALSMLLSWRGWNDVFGVWLFWLVVALIGYLTLSVLWSEPFSPRDALGMLGRTLLVFLFVVALAECQLRGDVQLWMGRLLALSGAGAALAAIAVFATGDAGNGRLSGLGQLDNPVVAGLVFSAVLIILLEMIASDPAKAWRLVACGCAVVVLLAVFLTGSRNAWISVFTGTLILFFSTRIQDRQRFVAAMIVMMVLICVAVLVLALNEETRQLLFPRGDSFRLEIWRSVLEQTTGKSLFFGHGILTPDSIRLVEGTFSHPHSMYFSVYFQGGLVALVLFGMLIAGGLRELFASYELRGAKLALSLLWMALTSYLLDGHELIDKVGETWFLFWLPIGFALGLSWQRQLADWSAIDEG